jgi:anti-sigma-K factor RskA
MSDHELHTLTGAYATDALDADERAAFETHLESCGSCRLEVVELRETAARLAVAAGAAAPSALRERVLAEVSQTRQQSPLGAVTGLDERRASGRPWYRQPATAAAAVLLVIATGLGGLAAVQNDRADQAQEQADAARQDAARIATVVADPDHIERTVPVASGGTGTVLAAGDVAVFLGNDLPELPDGRAYQLWRMSGQDSQSAGVLGRGGDVSGVVTDMGPGDAVGVSVEPESGSDRPTTDPVFVVSMA